MKKILIVEDEEALSGILKEEFSARKYEVKVANDGQEALALARSFKPDVILLDIILPVINGLDVLRELKSDSQLKDLLVIVSSNLASDEDVKKALELGAADYLIKTQNSINEMLEKIKKYLK